MALNVGRETIDSLVLHMYFDFFKKCVDIKTHSSESRGQGGNTSRRMHMSILQEQILLK